MTRIPRLLAGILLLAHVCAVASLDARAAKAEAARVASSPQRISPDELATLVAHHWRLVDARDREGARIEAMLDHGGPPLQLDLTDAEDRLPGISLAPERTDRYLSLSNLCNDQTHVFELGPGGIDVEYGPTTMMSCPGKLALLDDELSRRLSLRLLLTVGTAPPSLLLETAGGDILTFAGAPTPATRYGDPGELLHLEISHERVPCVHPAVPDGRCLQVREANLDADGWLLPSQQAWTLLLQEIEGFHHDDGIRSVVNVQRYRLPKATPDGLSFAYVWLHTSQSTRVERPVPRPASNEKPSTAIVTPRK